MASLRNIFGNAGRQVANASGRAFGVPNKPQTGWGSFLNAPATQAGQAAGQVAQAVPKRPTPGVPEPAAVPDDYINAYHASFANARSQIEDQYKTALQDLSGRESLSQGVVGSLPGRFNGIYNGANAQLAQQAQASLGQQQAQHLQSFAPQDTGVAAQAAAMTAGAASRQADVPLIQAGVTSESSRMRGGLGQARMGALADIATREDEANMAAQRDEADFRRQQVLANQQHQWDVEQSGGTPTWQQQRKDAREDALWQMRLQNKVDEAGQRQQARAGLKSFLPSDATPARALALREADPAQYRHVQESPAYRHAALASKVPFFGGWQEQARRLEKAGRPRAAAILRARKGK